MFEEWLKVLGKLFSQLVEKEKDFDGSKTLFGCPSWFLSVGDNFYKLNEQYPVFKTILNTKTWKFV